MHAYSAIRSVTDKGIFLARMLCLPLALGVLTGGAADAASVMIDDFNTPQSVTVTPSTTSASSSAAAAEAIGGERDMALNFTGGFTSMTVSSNPFGSQLLVHDSGATVTGTTMLVWDGPDGNPTVIDFVGLGGIDLLSGGLNEFRFASVLSDLTGSLVMTVYDASDATGDTWSQGTLNIPGGIFAPTDFSLPYASFTTVGPNGAANFANVGAISLLIDNTSGGSWDLAMDSIQAVPEPCAWLLAVMALLGACAAAPLNGSRRT